MFKPHLHNKKFLGLGKKPVDRVQLMPGPGRLLALCGTSILNRPCVLPSSYLVQIKPFSCSTCTHLRFVQQSLHQLKLHNSYLLLGKVSPLLLCNGDHLNFDCVYKRRKNSVCMNLPAKTLLNFAKHAH